MSFDATVSEFFASDSSERLGCTLVASDISSTCLAFPPESPLRFSEEEVVSIVGTSEEPISVLRDVLVLTM
jgi:hypothetical protein